jgi:nucleoside 2-deoxyribosyltransferase
MTPWSNLLLGLAHCSGEEGRPVVSTTKNPRIYLAGAEGFTPALALWHRDVLMPAVTAAGLVPVTPWFEFDHEFADLEAMEPGELRTSKLRDLDLRVGASNVVLIESAAGILAMLDGVDVDSGTASEIGFGCALGKLIVGVRTDMRRSGENEGTRVNLQVEYFIVRSGGLVYPSHDEAIVALATRLL